MPIVCINRPNRTVDRKFTCADAGRIARYAAENQGKKCVAAKVLSELGYKKGFCFIARLLSWADKLEDTKGWVSALGAVGTILAGIARIIKAGRRVVPFAGIALVILGILQLLLKTIGELLDESDTLQEVVELAGVVCADSESP